MKQPFLAVPVAFGHPRHGIARSTKLLRLDNVLEGYTLTPYNGDVLLFDRGMPEVYPALANSAGDGQEFYNYALISGDTRILHSRAISFSHTPAWIFLDSRSTRWLVRIIEPLENVDLDADTDFTMTLSFTRYGEFGGPWEYIEREQTVDKSVFGEDLETIAGWEIGIYQIACHDIIETRLRLEDVSRKGEEACISWAFFDSVTHPYASNYTDAFQRVPVALARITLDIDPSDDLPNWTIESYMARAECIPEHTYNGPEDSGCPQGNGAKSWETVGRVVGACYNDDGDILPVKLDIEWTEGYSAAGEETATFLWCPPGSTPPDYDYSGGASASSAATLQLSIDAFSISLTASASASASGSVTIKPNGTKDGGTGSISASASVGGESIGSYSGSLGNGSFSVYNYQTTSVDCGGGVYRAKDEYNVNFIVGSKIATPDIPTLCPTGPCIGEWPMGLMAGPFIIDEELSGIATGTLLFRRIANNLFGLLWRRDDTLDWTLHALLAPGGEVVDFRFVEPCTVGPGDPDCLTGGFKLTEQSTPFNLGNIDLTDIYGSHQPKTRETVIAVDGIAVCYV